MAVYMDQKNLNNEKFTTELVLCWRLMLEEYTPTTKYIKVPAKKAADTLGKIPLITLT